MTIWKDIKRYSFWKVVRAGDGYFLYTPPFYLWGNGCSNIHIRDIDQGYVEPYKIEPCSCGDCQAGRDPMGSWGKLR